MPEGRLLVAEKGAGTLGVIDLESGARIGGVASTGVVPHEVVASADGATALLPVYGDANVGESGADGRTVDVVDLCAFEVIRTVDLGEPSRPHDAALGPDGRAVLTAEVRRQLLVVDAATGEVRSSAPTGREQSHMVAIAADGRRAYTVNVGPGSVSVIDLVAREVISVVELGTRVNRIALTPDGRSVITADQAAPRLALIDTESFTVEWLPIPAVGYSTAATPDGRLVIALRGTNEVAVLDLERRRIEHVIPVPATPQRVVVHGLAYVSCDRSAVVVELDPASGTVLRTFPTGAGPDGMAWAPRPS